MTGYSTEGKYLRMVLPICRRTCMCILYKDFQKRIQQNLTASTR